MIIGAHSIIHSKKPAADRAFLRDVLELPSVDVGEGWLIFGLPPAEVAVHPAEKNNVHEFFLMCDDIDGFIEQVRAHGVSCTRVQSLGWGRLTRLKLPGGGRLGVYEPRHARPKSLARRRSARGLTRAKRGPGLTPCCGERAPGAAEPEIVDVDWRRGMRPAEIAAEFVARINAHDVVGLSELMTDDHLFIDALDNRGVGRDAMRAAWNQYLASVPDYWIKVDTILQEDGTVALFGRAGGTYAGRIPEGQSAQWEVPAAWLAEVRRGQVAMWRVYADNLPMRRLTGSERE